MPYFRHAFLALSCIYMAFSSNSLSAQANPSLSSLAGYWSGKLSVQGTSLTIGFSIHYDEEVATASMDSPDQGAKGIPVSRVARAGNAVRLEVSSAGGYFEGVLSSDGKKITGFWIQGGKKIPLDLSLSDSAPIIRKPQDPKAPFPYKSEELSISNSKAAIKLAGTLLIPEGTGPFPLVILISGSGPQNRDEEILGHKPFWIIADCLARRGMASFRYDDRGVASSTGDFGSATTMDFADDVETILETLSTRREINARKIGLIGHSEGGLIAPIVAARNAKASFIVLLAGPGIRGDELLVIQNEALAKASGVTETEIRQSSELNRKLYALARKNPANLKAEARKLLVAYFDSRPELSKTQKDSAMASIDQIIAPLASPWLRIFLSLDPKPFLEKLAIPVLAINGSKDLQVPAAINLAAISKALTTAGNKQFMTRELAGLNHLFQHATTGLPDEYGTIQETISPEALELIASWIKSIKN